MSGVISYSQEVDESCKIILMFHFEGFSRHSVLQKLLRWEHRESAWVTGFAGAGHVYYEYLCTKVYQDLCVVPIRLVRNNETQAKAKSKCKNKNKKEQQKFSAFVDHRITII